jgi:sugar phosphate isomerase/epimerase
MLGDTPMMRETRTRLAETGVRVLDVEVLRLRPDSRHDDALRILDAGERLGARGVLVIANDPEETRLVERFRAVCEAAAERGMRACLEFMIFSSVRTLDDAVRIVDRTAHRAAAILVDALHMQRSGATPAEVAALQPAWLPYAQLCDAPSNPVRPPEDVARTEARTGRLLPGDGGLPLCDLIAALPTQASLAVESPVAELADRSPNAVARLAYEATAKLLTRQSSQPSATSGRKVAGETRSGTSLADAMASKTLSG